MTGSTAQTRCSLLLLLAAVVAGASACSGGSGGGAADGDESTSGEGTADATTGDVADSSTDADTGETSNVDTTGEESAGVDIFRDEHGVPHIVADTDEGALYGLGYASAEDRLLQMTLSALAAQGRLAEFFGSDYFEHDQRFRIMGHWRHAQAIAESLDDEHRVLLSAYADGVNAWVAAHPDAISPMFEELGLAVPTWTPAHSLAIWYRVSDLFTNDPMNKAQGLLDFETEVAQVGLAQAIADATAAQNPGDSDAGVVQASDVPQSVQDAIAAYATKMGYGEQQQAPHNYGHITPKFSHAWVVGGDRSTTGDAVLVSDPQVPVLSPNFLYEWAVVGDRVHARGSGVAGVPGLLIGYTPDIAWGLTAAGIDSRDLFRLDMSGTSQYIVDDEVHDLAVETETILIAGGQSRTVEYRSSLWGPVVTGLIPQASGEYAMKGLPFSADERDPFVAMVAMMRATNLDELRGAVREWTTPSANIVAAGPDGGIFFTVLGDIPLRSPASPLGGMIAQDGSSTQFDWVDVIPNEFKPWVEDPASGMVLSANHRPVGDWYPLPLGAGQGARGDTIRSRRLRELLVALPEQVDPRAVLDDVQWDCVNPTRRDLVAVARHIDGAAPGRLSQAARNALNHLQAWSAAGGSMLTDQPGAFLADRIGVKFRILQTGPILNAQYGGGQNGMSMFLDDMIAQIAADPSYAPIDDAIAYVDTTLADAWTAATMANPDPDQWDAAYLDEAAQPTLEFLVGFDLTVPPTNTTVDVPTLRCVDGNTIWSQKGETYTQFVDMSAIDSSETILAPGNPEGPQGDLWRSQLQGWADGSLKSTALTLEAIDALGTPAVTLELP